MGMTACESRILSLFLSFLLGRSPLEGVATLTGFEPDDISTTCHVRILSKKSGKKQGFYDEKQRKGGEAGEVALTFDLGSLLRKPRKV